MPEPHKDTNFSGYQHSIRSKLMLQGINVVGHFVFTKELLPLLLENSKESPTSTRIIWISSYGHFYAPEGIINFDDVNLTNERSWKSYSQSKAVTLSLFGR